MHIQGVSTTLTATSRAISRPQDRALAKACEEFEAVFLSMIWRQMQKSVGNDLGGWDAIAEQALGQYWAKSGGIGLAKVIYKDMSKPL